MSESIVKRIRIVNVSRNKGGAGKFLDMGKNYDNIIIGPGRHRIVSVPNGALPDFVEKWCAQGDAVAYDADKGDVISGPVAGDITPGVLSPTRQMTNHDDPEMEEFNPKYAKEAYLPAEVERTRPVAGDLNQYSKVRVTTGSEDNTQSHDISPIPGERPRYVDKSEEFTVRAPRAREIGQVGGFGKS